MEFLQGFINNFHVLPEESYQKFLQLTVLKKFSKDDILTKVGEIPKELYILKKGLVRSYYIDNKGKEHIRSLFRPFSSTGSLGGLISNKPSNLTYQCLTDCELYAINFEKLKTLTYNDKDVGYMYARALESIFLLFEDRIFDLSVLNATERYLKLKEEITDIDNLIPQYHIASYLNVSPVQLSRIRKELYHK